MKLFITRKISTSQSNLQDKMGQRRHISGYADLFIPALNTMHQYRTITVLQNKKVTVNTYLNVNATLQKIS